MKVSRLIILNYRSCSFVNLYFKGTGPVVFVGPNDSGKTTILNSFKFLFKENEQILFSSDKSGKHDLSFKQADQELVKNTIECPEFATKDEVNFVFKLEFTKEEVDQYLNLEKFSPLFKWIISRDQSVWIRRSMSPNGSQFYAIAEDYAVTDSDEKSETLKSLWELKDAEISKMMTKEINSKIQNRNGLGKASVFEKIEALYLNSGKTLSKSWVSVEHKEFKQLLPNFESFTWNFNLSQIHTLASSYIDADDKNKIEAIRSSAESVESDIAAKIKQKMLPTLGHIQESVPLIKDLFAKVYVGVNHEVTDVLVRKEGFDGDIHVDSQGEGLKRQIWFSLLKSQAQNVVEGEELPPRIWTFDEPEIHLYPKAQREFFESLKRLTVKNMQIFINTHSSIFVNKASLSDVHIARIENGETKLSLCESAEEVTTSLGVINSDILFYNKFLLVEGITELAFFSKILDVVYGVKLNDVNTKIIELGGGTKTKTTLESLIKILGDMNHKKESILILLDKDQQRDQKKLEEKYFIDYVGDYDFEDFLPNEVWEKYLLKAFSDNRFHLTKNEIQELRKNLGFESNKKFMNVLRSHLILNKANGDHSLINIHKSRIHGELLADSVIELKMTELFVKHINYILN